MDEQDNRDLYSTKMLASMLSKDGNTIRMLAAKHKIGIRFGRDWIFNAADIERMRAIPGPGRPRKVKSDDPLPTGNPE